MFTRSSRVRAHKRLNLVVIFLSTLIAGGCLIVPKTTISERTTHSRRIRTPQRPGAAVLTATVHEENQLIIAVLRRRKCKLRAIDTIEVSREASAGLEILAPSGGGPRGPLGAPLFVAWIVLAPVTATASGLVTAGILLVDEPARHSEERTRSVTQSSCPMPLSGVGVAVELPSGLILSGTTNRSGQSHFAIPDSEPARGTVIVRSALSRTKSFWYGYSQAPLSRHEVLGGLQSVRNQVEACGAEHAASGRHPLTIVIDSGLATLIPELDMNESFAGCIDSALAAATFRPAPRLKVAFPFDFGSPCREVLRSWSAQTDPRRKALIYRDMAIECQMLITQTPPS